jgi:hypothetical protein
LTRVIDSQQLTGQMFRYRGAMPRKYYPIRLRLEWEDLYLIWFSDDTDGVVLEKDNSVASFRTRSELISYAARHGLLLEAEEPTLFDVDSVERWLDRPDSEAIDCSLFLDSWNLFTDIASSRGDSVFDRDSRAAETVYHKLFWGNNLPAVTPPGEHYGPIWSDEEVSELQQVLCAGMVLLRDGVKR